MPNRKEFADDTQQLALWAKALGHPARIAILNLLARHRSCICGDITDQLPLAQSTVSQHLKALKKVGIIKGEVEGVRTCYCLNDEVIPELKQELSAFLTELASCCPQQDSCC
jgi:DNA-binding transcriptional ArsR family regulator